jgi:hypothetical protein
VRNRIPGGCPNQGVIDNAEQLLFLQKGRLITA